MDTILIINVISSAVAGIGLAGLGLRARRAERRRAAVKPIYIPVAPRRARRI